MRTDLLRRHAATQLLKYNNAKDEGCTHGGAIYIGQSSSTTLDGCHFVASSSSSIACGFNHQISKPQL
jgi:hypothetical protein